MMNPTTIEFIMDWSLLLLLYYFYHFFLWYNMFSLLTNWWLGFLSILLWLRHFQAGKEKWLELRVGSGSVLYTICMRDLLVPNVCVSALRQGFFRRIVKMYSIGGWVELMWWVELLSYTLTQHHLPDPSDLPFHPPSTWYSHLGIWLCFSIYNLQNIG